MVKPLLSLVVSLEFKLDSCVLIKILAILDGDAAIFRLGEESKVEGIVFAHISHLVGVGKEC